VIGRLFRLVIRMVHFSNNWEHTHSVKRMLLAATLWIALPATVHATAVSVSGADGATGPAGLASPPASAPTAGGDGQTGAPATAVADDSGSLNTATATGGNGGAGGVGGASQPGAAGGAGGAGGEASATVVGNAFDAGPGPGLGPGDPVGFLFSGPSRATGGAARP